MSGDDQPSRPHMPKKRLGPDPADESKGGEDPANTAIERNTVLAGHGNPSECH